MLSRLYIENIALIGRLDMSLSAGFNVLTGETGAGKSIIIDSVNLVLGERADRDLIKSGEDKALVEAVFDLEAPICAKLNALGIECEDDQLYLSRELSVTGKNNCRINGRPAPLSMIKMASDLLVDMYGQHEHQTLFNTESHLSFIDAYGNQNIAPIVEQLMQKYARWKKLRTLLRSEYGSDAEIARKADFLAYQIKEIESANLIATEEEALVKERKIISNAEHIQSTLMQGYEWLSGEETVGALALVKLCADKLGEISSYSEEYESLRSRTDNAYYLIEDISAELRHLRDLVFFNPYRQQEIEQRLNEIYELKRKYGGNVEAILLFLEKAQKELDGLEEIKKLSKEGEQQLRVLEKELYELSLALSAARKKAARTLEQEMICQLEQLGMNKVCFVADFSQFPAFHEGMDFSLNGLDKVELLFSANAGEPPRPLRKVASGGELSRIMLAFKSVFANVQSCPILIFDEIDSGISGHIASVVGQKMVELSSEHQVICVTHSPQIAAMAQTHFLIEKTDDNGSTSTRVRKLSYEEHIAEVARIISGKSPGRQAFAHARELVESGNLFNY